MLILGLTNRSAFDGSTNEGHRKMLNVSIVTVSKVLNKNDPNISEATRQRVLQRAKKLNYRTNLAAKGTNSIRYNADKGLNQQRTLKFDAALLKPGENEMTFTVPGGDLQSGVVWDYLRLELDDNH